MKIVNRETIEIGISYRSGKPIYWKPEWCGTQENFHKLDNGKDFKFLNQWSYFVPIITQLFWLKFIFYIKIKPKLISGDPKYPSRLVRIEDTHLSVCELPHGSWDGRPLETGKIYK